MKKGLIFFLLLILPCKPFCQKTDAPNLPFTYKNSVQAELFGYNFLYWINYERIFINGQKFKTSGLIGLTYTHEKYFYTQYRLPVMLIEMRSFNKHHIEMGLGCAFIKTLGQRDYVNLSNYEVFSLVGHGKIGYRYQKPNGRFLFKISFTPLFTGGFFSKTDDKLQLNPSGSLTFGYCF